MPDVNHRGNSIHLLPKGDAHHTSPIPLRKKGELKGDVFRLKFNPPVSPFSKGDFGDDDSPSTKRDFEKEAPFCRDFGNPPVSPF